jgi:anthranilate/para-aminobenzoate synthase component II
MEQVIEELQLMKILLIDNYDSFTYNIVHLFAALPDVEVVVSS